MCTHLMHITKLSSGKLLPIFILLAGISREFWCKVKTNTWFLNYWFLKGDEIEGSIDKFW